jgi:hypothetical protein
MEVGAMLAEAKAGGGLAIAIKPNFVSSTYGTPQKAQVRALVPLPQQT